MKKLLLLVVVIAVITVGGIATASHYKNYQNKKTQEDARIAAGVASIEQQRQKQTSELTAKKAELEGMYNTQVAECEKGVVAYGKLTQAVKNQTPEPVCGTKL